MDRLAKLMGTPAFRKKYLANINATGKLFLRARLAAFHSIDDTQRYRPAIIKNEDGIFPALIADDAGNRMYKASTGITISIPGLKRHFGMPDNQKVILRKYNTKRYKGFLLMHPTDVWKAKPVPST